MALIAHHERLVDILKQLVQIESTTGCEGRLAAFIHDCLVRMELAPRLIPLDEGRASVGVRIQGSGAGTVVFCGHIDTVDVRNQPWTRQPFDAAMEGNRLYGRGAADMKGGVTSMLGTAQALAERGAPPAKSIVFMFTADEERSYRGATSLVDAGFADGAELLVIPEPTEGRVCLGQKGQLWVDVDIAGRAAHGALPEHAANAALAAADLALTVTADYGKLDPKPRRGRSTVSANEIHGGWQVNVVPNTAHVTFDFRPVDAEDHDAALTAVDQATEKVGRRWGVRAERRLRQNKMAIASDPADPAVDAFLRVAGVAGDAAHALEITPYSTDGAAIVPRLGIPMVVCGPGSIVQAHQPDEYLEVEQLFEVHELFVRYVTGSME